MGVKVVKCRLRFRSAIDSYCAAREAFSEQVVMSVSNSIRIHIELF